MKHGDQGFSVESRFESHCLFISCEHILWLEIVNGSPCPSAIYNQEGRRDRVIYISLFLKDFIYLFLELSLIHI